MLGSKGLRLDYHTPQKIKAPDFAGGQLSELVCRTEDQAMEIESTTFGAITIDGKNYEHDVVIRLSGEVVKRKKKLSKKY